MKDKEKPKIIIKNYAYIFQPILPLLLAAVIFSLYIIWKYLKILAIDGGEVRYAFYASIIALLFYISYTINRVRNFLQDPPVFIFTKTKILYDYYKENRKFHHVIKKEIDDITKMAYILHTEAPYQYGKINKKPLVKRFFKDDIGDNFIYLMVYLSGFVSLAINLPIKAMVLVYNKEPLSLLYRNLLIEFDDATAMIVNIYRENDYKKIVELFKENGKEIRDRIVFNIYLKEEE